jgi:chromosome segregation ATPase
MLTLCHQSELAMMKRAYRQVEDELRVARNDYAQLQGENQHLRAELTSRDDKVNNLKTSITLLQVRLRSVHIFSTR